MTNGTYKARVTAAALSVSTNGKEHAAVELEFYELEGAPKLTWFGYFSGGAFEHTMKGLRSAGLVGADVSDLTSMVGNEVSAVVENEEYEGKTRTKVRWLNSPAGPSLIQPMDAASAKAFAAKLRGQVAAFDKSTSAPKVTGSTLPKKAKPVQGVLSPEPPPFADSEDIPF